MVLLETDTKCNQARLQKCYGKSSAESYGPHVHGLADKFNITMRIKLILIIKHVSPKLSQDSNGIHRLTTKTHTHKWSKATRQTTVLLRHRQGRNQDKVNKFYQMKNYSHQIQ